ncbi:CBD9-like protein [Aureobasidium sp. EXF-12298]|nr:CBD9-like protein [Aureobasidium sp. EXF-12298]
MSTSLYRTETDYPAALLFAFFAVAFAGNGTSTYTYQHQGSTAFHLDLGLNTTGNDLYFNMSAPSTYSWLAFGIGGQMKNSFMFIGYPSSNGSGKEILPDIYTSSKDVQVRSSSITNGTYQLMGVCYNCTAWSLGKMDTSSTNQPFIFALGPSTDTISSDSMSQNIAQHTMYNSFSMDMTQAAFSGSNTPALNSGGNSGSSHGGPSSGSTHAASENVYNRVHGIFMAIAFVILFPLGVLVLRLGHSVIAHGIIQATAYCFVIVGFGTGIYLSDRFGYNEYKTAHQIIGLVLFALLAIQALGGLIHHLLFRRGHKTIIGKVHMFLGICLLILGIVNVPLGLNQSGDSNYNTAYIIVVAILGAIFLALRFFALWRDRRVTKREGSEKGVLRRGSSSDEAAVI